MKPKENVFLNFLTIEPISVKWDSWDESFLGLPPWLHLRTRCWSVFTLHWTRRLTSCSWHVWYCKSWE